MLWNYYIAAAHASRARAHTNRGYYKKTVAVESDGNASPNIIILSSAADVHESLAYKCASHRVFIERSWPVRFMEITFCSFHGHPAITKNNSGKEYQLYTIV